MSWKFVESEEDGEAWMQNPSEFHTFVDFRTNGRPEWRRIMVVTKSWVERQLVDVKIGSAGPGRAVFAAMLVLPDAAPPQLRSFIDTALAAGGIDHFAASGDQG